MVDKAVTQKAAAAQTGGRYRLPEQLLGNLREFVVAPRRAFGASFWMVCGVYGATCVRPLPPPAPAARARAPMRSGGELPDR